MPEFSKFRSVMNQWDDIIEEETKDLVKVLVARPQFVIYFQKGEGVFAGPEESRIDFSRFKSGDEKIAGDDFFSALNLVSALLGERILSTFGADDLKDIKVIDQDDAIKLLTKKAKKSKDAVSGIKQFLSMLDV